MCSMILAINTMYQNTFEQEVLLLSKGRKANLEKKGGRILGLPKEIRISKNSKNSDTVEFYVATPRKTVISP